MSNPPFPLLKILFLLTTLFVAVHGNEDGRNIDEKIAALLAKMTVEEKVGQMTQVTIQAVAKTEGTATQAFELDQKKLEEAISRYQVGSLLNVWNVAMTVDEWQDMIKTIHKTTRKKSRLKIPIIYGIDAIHGNNYTRDATIFPQSFGIAATWNLDLARIEGEITALEARASGIPWNFNPVLGLGRNPLWPRFWETFGEDPYVAGMFGAAYVEGMQGHDVSAADKVAGCMKHYIGYSLPLSGKDRTPAWIPERILRDMLLPPFQRAVDAGVKTVMINSGEVNGIPAHADEFLLKTLLREELGFEGFVVTDWEDIERLYTRDKVAGSYKEAVKMAINAGIDMSMVPFNFEFYTHLVELVNEGEVPMERIDDAVSRILRVKYELGLFDDPNPYKKVVEKFGSETSRQAALRAARESMTLLKNADRRLPLAKSSRVLVTGPTANLMSALNGGWTMSWQGNWEELYPKEKHTVLEAIQEKIGSKQVSYVDAAGFQDVKDLQAAVTAAQNVDAIILCLGEPAYCETPGNIGDLDLPAAQIELAQALQATGKPVILVLLEGRPRVIRPIVDQSDAILMAYLPGMEGGIAIADVLFGDYNPGGKLPFTYPRYSNDLTLYDHKFTDVLEGNSFHPQWEFGHGLSYTTYEYGDIIMDRAAITEEQEITIRIPITNTGDRSGRENVLLFIRDKVRSITPPVKQLKRFASLEIQPGESRTVEFTIDSAALSFVGRDNARILEAGEFEIIIGPKTATFSLVKSEDTSEQ